MLSSFGCLCFAKLIDAVGDGCSALHEAAKEEVARQFVAHQTVLAQIEARLLYFVDKFELEAVKQGTPGYCRVPSAHTASSTVYRYGPSRQAAARPFRPLQRAAIKVHCCNRVHCCNMVHCCNTVQCCNTVHCCDMVHCCNMVHCALPWLECATAQRWRVAGVRESRWAHWDQCNASQPSLQAAVVATTGGL